AISKKRWIGLGLIIAVMLVIVVRDSSLLKDTEKIRGGFTETAFKRNENNSGPVIRLYAVKVDSPLVADFEGYGNSMPHTEHGSTRIFYFDSSKGAPNQLSLETPYYDTSKYEAISIFQKNAVGDVSEK